MITVYCFSGSGHSLAVSKELSKLLDCEIRPIDNKTTTADTAVVVFPVYCQNIPKPVKRFLKGLEAKYVALIATYGKYPMAMFCMKHKSFCTDRSLQGRIFLWDIHSLMEIANLM